MHLDRFPGATVVPFDGQQLPEAEMRAWLDGLDVVYSAETLYDWRLADWAREAGARTVVHVNPEFYRHAREDHPHSDALWAPTPWRLEHLPPETPVVPMPVALDRFEAMLPPEGGPLRVLHVVGRRAMADRNGTRALYRALRMLRVPVKVRVVTQDARLMPPPRTPWVDAKVVVGGVPDYWALYEEAQVLVLPRRYGGLSLPAQEAMAAGLAVVMTDCAPQATFWPVLTVACDQRGAVQAPAGDIPLYDANPTVLAALLTRLAEDETLLRSAQHAGLGWASAHSWDALRPVWLTALRAACR